MQSSGDSLDIHIAAPLRERMQCDGACDRPHRVVRTDVPTETLARLEGTADKEEPRLRSCWREPPDRDGAQHQHLH
eukprot:6209462-Pleurochrysis_carterae.AAC.3